MHLEHPYGDLTGGQWLRGNLHAHTTRSDGQRPTQEVIDDYAARQYGFLMISDHDIYTAQQDYAQFDARGMVLIPGNEISRNGPHLLHVGADRKIEPTAQRQRVIQDIAASQGFTIVNHPNWFASFNHCSIEQLNEWVGYLGMEIYNGVISRLEGSPYSTNKWDILLGKGRRVWGFANDDSHSAKGDVELGWNTAYVKQKDTAGVLEALTSGRFYCSTGVVISKIEVDGLRIRLETENAQRIVALHQTAKRFATAQSNVIEVTVPENATYVRFECWGQGEQFAWTQPFYAVP